MNTVNRVASVANLPLRIYNYDEKGVKYCFDVKKGEEPAARNLVEIVFKRYVDLLETAAEMTKDEYDEYFMGDEPPVWIELYTDDNGRLSESEKPVWCGARLNFKQGDLEGEVTIPSTLALLLQTAVEDGDLELERFMFERIPAPQWRKFVCQIYPPVVGLASCEWAYGGKFVDAGEDAEYREVYIDMSLLTPTTKKGVYTLKTDETVKLRIFTEDNSITNIRYYHERKNTYTCPYCGAENIAGEGGNCVSCGSN